MDIYVDKHTQSLLNCYFSKNANLREYYFARSGDYKDDLEIYYVYVSDKKNIAMTIKKTYQ